MKVSKVQTTKIDLGERSCYVYIGAGVLSKFGKIAAEHKIPHRLAIITDKNVAKLHLDDFIRQI
jgi:3-dehydroquinate synthetase